MKDVSSSKHRIWPLLLVVAMYTVLFAPVLLIASQSPPVPEGSEPAFPELPLLLLGFFILFYLTTSVGSLVHVVRSAVRGETELLGRQASVLKMVSIPWFVINFLVNFLFFSLFGIVSRGLIIFFIPAAVFITWCVMMGSTIYSLGYLILLKKEKRIEIPAMVFHGWLQLMFMTDVIGILVLRRQMKKADQNQHRGDNP
jgi:hypothetical protein